MLRLSKTMSTGEHVCQLQTQVNNKALLKSLENFDNFDINQLYQNFFFENNNDENFEKINLKMETDIFVYKVNLSKINYG